MKTIGLIGGTGWVSTIEYYRAINQLVNGRLGGSNSARIILYSLNYGEFKKLSDAEEWTTMGHQLTTIARDIEKCGADCLLLCANTMHMVADIVQKGIHIPVIHIAEETANEISNQKIKKVGLLGTKFTMEQTFFISKLKQQHIEPIIPDLYDRNFIHTTIFDELGKGIFKYETRIRYLEIIEGLKEQGAEAIIFGCTELSLLIPETASPLKVFDTLQIHVQAAVDFALL